MSSSPAQPLKVNASASSSKPPSQSSTRESTPAAAPAKQSVMSNPSDISSPHELTAYVESLLEQLDAKFDDMSTQILDRMMQMSARVDALEASIQDIINGDVPTNTSTTSVPQSPSPMGTATSSNAIPRRA
ncbi:hypothetical protein GLOTRDRAFT_77844 [Gloeophyllum trabeum ATCC 11539]|uniref:Heat shock factor binding protein 1 n=1 Tax=Gloeophyllum trabeum (strain ATCC 11539 / FP-39264 / Madison 617) TaxID=670483 RepID=S7RMR0_GLOTA|nr:uncharacterized protein GLOTRDRAFT_77844 [Gloeophyllum trabeum ATCC 11539]EPQ53969.1 hypothetical protein GLOTRDRAFT_77844 [Gloeophyllum trabeum ATCC 11539]